MNRYSIFTLALMGAIGVAAATPEIQDGSVVLSPSGGSGRMVSVRYVLAGAEGIVTADLLTNGVSVGEANLATLSTLRFNFLTEPSRPEEFSSLKTAKISSAA